MCWPAGWQGRKARWPWMNHSSPIQTARHEINGPKMRQSKLQGMSQILDVNKGMKNMAASIKTLVCLSKEIALDTKNIINA